MAEILSHDQNTAHLLPELAPRIRITVGAGTTSQKSFYLRRAVSVVGSDSRSCVRVNGPRSMQTHCAFVNTGSVVLLKDLHTPDGTFCNGQPIDLTVLHDGDVACVDGSTVQIAIKHYRRNEPEVRNPPMPPHTLRLTSADPPGTWDVRDNCSIIGRSDRAEVRLDGAGILPVHAILFALGEQWVVHNLSGDQSCTVDGAPVDTAVIRAGCALTIADHVFSVSEAPETSSRTPKDHPRSGSPRSSTDQDHRPPPPAAPSAGGESLANVAHKLSALRKDIDDSWRRMNVPVGTEPEPVPDDPATLQAKNALAAREAELDQRDASLRGRLCDLNGLSEELAERERELRTQKENLEADLARLEGRAKQCEATLLAWQKRLETREHRVRNAERQNSRDDTSPPVEAVGEDTGQRKHSGLLGRFRIRKTSHSDSDSPAGV